MATKKKAVAKKRAVAKKAVKSTANKTTAKSYSFQVAPSEAGTTHTYRLGTRLTKIDVERAADSTIKIVLTTK